MPPLRGKGQTGQQSVAGSEVGKNLEAEAAVYGWITDEVTTT